MEVREIRINDFDYPLPDERIAQHPLERRDACRLLVSRASGRVAHRTFSDLPLLLEPDTLIVANETKVIRARMEFENVNGAKIEVFLLEPVAPVEYATNLASVGRCSWFCLIGNKKRWKAGPLMKKVEIPGRETPVMIEALWGGATQGAASEIFFHWDAEDISFAELLEYAGNIPIPPYLKRKSEDSDTTDYQTVYSRTEGSVAAPTAGLHFTEELIDRLKKKGIEFTTVTLHVGAGTFQPVKSESIGCHRMHSEPFTVSRRTLGRVIDALETGRNVLAVGTTAVRTLESLPYLGIIIEEGQYHGEFTRIGQWDAYEEKYREVGTLRLLHVVMDYMKAHDLDEFGASTSIMIAPGFRWRVVNRLITNFHQPKSTLLLLVSSFLDPMGEGTRWRYLYAEALKEGYRFLSYGDACLFARGEQKVVVPPAKSMVIRAATLLAIRNPEGLGRMMIEAQCDDTVHYVRALQEVLASANERTRKEIYIGEGAAPLRFLVALSASMEGCDVRITCAPPLRRRPILPLVEALRRLGADIELCDSDADWHIDVKGKTLRGGKVEVDASFTSQYLSALMLASLLWQEGMECEAAQTLAVSRPYLEMTRRMMAQESPSAEPDWSGAAFFYQQVMMGLHPELTFARLTPPEDSLQGDSACCRIYAALGVATQFNADGSAMIRKERGERAEDREVKTEGRESRLERVEIDFSDYPDMVPSVAVALCYCRIPFRFTGVGHLKYKECDRLSALQRNLMSLGYEVEAESDALTFSGEFRPMEELPVDIDTYGDHRMVMAFYPLELLQMARLTDKRSIAKSFPDFFTFC